MDYEAQVKILRSLDVLSVEVGAGRNDTAELKSEVRSGFGRVERRLGNLQTRVERLEVELRSFRVEFDRRIAPLEQ